MEPQITTFGELDAMISAWTRDLNECRNIFINQADELRDRFWRTESNGAKLEFMHTKFALLKYNHDQLEYCLMSWANLEAKVEQLVEKLEDCMARVQTDLIADLHRERLYGLFDCIYCDLNNCKNDTELLEKETSDLIKDFDVEQIMKIMTKLLQLLEWMESQAQRMLCLIQWIDNESRRILAD